MNKSFWNGFEKQAWFWKKKNTQPENSFKTQEKKNYRHLKKIITNQKLTNHLHLIKHPSVKPDQRNNIMQEIIRRYGDPIGKIKANTGGGRGDHAYSPNYLDKYWRSIGGDVSENRKAVNQRILKELKKRGKWG